ncbi:site-specific DNA-methyltransferase [Vagococcus lutrae]|uniref:site-specific DNA-methyltransferase n=1 Tax=Vagococcus lutrae TaxID=81947 RepID=UPI002892651F|nr:site-specific DNA-methyltransferase [Vagococcus lutrae]MDT2823472.1 site-specific DNA-methyltransferase [Vagococcus lutrae]
MEKLDMQTKDLANENYEKLKALFPNAITETIDNEGNIVRAIDKDILMQEISTEVVEGREERYQFTWPDKRQAIANANAPTSKTLRPCREESVNFDKTENLYIEGDNLEVLKLLQETYLGKIKMIYIDPPYNTGNDFVYNDNFSMDRDEYLEDSGQFDEEGNRLEKNLETNGRFHTDWINMMYPRLKLARNLLTDDGVMFISIDDNELENLKKICDEIFGEVNFITTITREAIKGGSLSKHLRIVTDYVIVYAKNMDNVKFGGIPTEGFILDREDEHGRYMKGRELNKWGVGARREDSPGMWFPIPGPNGEEIYPIRNDGSEGRWRVSKKNIMNLIKNNNVIYEKRENGTFIVYEKIRDDSPRLKQFTNLFINDYINSKGSEELKKIFNSNLSIFDYSKPPALIFSLIQMSSLDKDSIILDFFSGSATTAHATMQLNASDTGNRKFIMVQIPEETDEKSEAYKAGYKNICEIGKERIRRVGRKILEENQNKEGIENLDIGFRVLKTDSSNMKDVYYAPSQTEQSLLDMLSDNIKEDRSPEDLLFQVMLDLGISLSSKIERELVDDKEVFIVEDGFLMACFDKNITEETVKAIAKEKPYYAVFRDLSMANDSVATNFEQIFENMSPQTVRKVI